MNRRHFLMMLKSARYCNNNNLMQFHVRTLWIPEFDRTGANLKINKQQFRHFHQPNNDELIAEFQSSTRGMPLKAAAEEVEETAQNADEWGIMQQKPQKVTHLPNPQIHQPKLHGESTRRILAKRVFTIGTGKGQLRLVYLMGRGGQKFLELGKHNEGIVYTFPNILVPEDVFSFMQAMDEVLNAVHTNRNKIQAPAKLLQERLPLHTAKAKGANYDFQLELYLTKNLHVRIRMQTAPKMESNQEDKPKSMVLPLRQFHWFRLAIGHILMECDRRRVQRPPNFPGWLNDDGFPHVLPPSPNNNNFVARKPQQPHSQQQPLKTDNKTTPSTTSPTTTVALMQQLLQMFGQQQKQLQQMQDAIGAWLRQRGGKEQQWRQEKPINNVSPPPPPPPPPPK